LTAVCVTSSDGAVPWLTGCVAGLSPRKRGFIPSPAHVRFMVYKVATGQVFLRLLRFSITPPMLSTHLHLHVAVTRKTKKQEPSKNQCLFGNREALDRKVLSLFSAFKGEVSGVVATTYGRPESLPLDCYDLN
jgi:hypothetical protein